MLRILEFTKVMVIGIACGANQVLTIKFPTLRLQKAWVLPINSGVCNLVASVRFSPYLLEHLSVVDAPQTIDFFCRILHPEKLHL